MAGLDEELSKVEQLREDLKAIRVFQHEEGYVEPEEYIGDGGTDAFSWTKPRYIVTQQRIEGPDFEKRKYARTQLREISKTSQVFRVRYNARKALLKNNRPVIWVQENSLILGGGIVVAGVLSGAAYCIYQYVN